jgi:hypothetical protein
MERAGCPLHNAPERFFDQKKWEALIGLVGNRDSALALVSNHPSGKSPENNLTVELRNEFRRRLVDGSIVATASVLNSLQVTRISPSRCQNLWPDFMHDRLENNLEKFVDVYVLDAGQLTDVSYTEARDPAGGEGHRKALEGQASTRSAGKRPRITTYLTKHFPTGVPGAGHYSRKKLRTELIEWDSSLDPLDDGTLKKAIDAYNAGLEKGKT